MSLRLDTTHLSPLKTCKSGPAGQSDSRCNSPLQLGSETVDFDSSLGVCKRRPGSAKLGQRAHKTVHVANWDTQAFTFLCRAEAGRAGFYP